MRKVIVVFEPRQRVGYQYDVRLVQGPATLANTLHATEEEADAAARVLASHEGVPYVPRLK